MNASTGHTVFQTTPFKVGGNAAIRANTLRLTSWAGVFGGDVGLFSTDTGLVFNGTVGGSTSAAGLGDIHVTTTSRLRYGYISSIAGAVHLTSSGGIEAATPGNSGVYTDGTSMYLSAPGADPRIGGCSHRLSRGPRL